MRMKKLNYNNQLFLSCISVFAGGIASWLLEIPVLRNLGWIIGGLLFVIHPVFPEKSADIKHMKLFVRLAGLLLILIGVGIQPITG